MTTLLLRLAGPMQSWGDSSRFSRRRTRLEPTKSGVLGLLAAADGRRRTDPIEDLAQLRFGVRTDQPGRILRDFQTARSLDGARIMPVAHRYYLSDAVFVAGVEGDENLLAGLAERVSSPAFPLYLGRRSCAPAHPVFVGLVPDDLETALRQARWEAAPWHRRRQAREVHLDLIRDRFPEDSDGAGETVRDLPLSFDPVRREYGWRDVERPAPVTMPNPEGQDSMDFMALHGGSA